MSLQPRVAVLTQWYPPEPAHQAQWIVEALHQRGAHCEVVTGVPNYPTGRTTPGYRAWQRSEEVRDGFRVVRTPLYPHHGAGVLRRLANYASWALSSTLFARRVLASADVVLVYSSPATAALAAWVARRLHGVPYVLLIQDLWPDTVTQSGMLPRVLRRPATAVLGYFAKVSYRDAAAVVVTSPGMRLLLLRRGVPEDRISLTYNWVSPVTGQVDEGVDLRSRLGLPQDAVVVLYAGNHGAAQGLGPVLGTFSALPPDVVCHLVLVGDGIEKSRLQEAFGGSDRVHFVDAQPPATAQAWMRSADALLVSLVDRPLFNATTPSKLQMALAMGRPVLASARGDAATIVLAAEAGLVVPPGDSGALTEALRDLVGASAGKRARWGTNGRSYYEKHMSQEVGAGQITSILRAECLPATEQGRERHRVSAHD